MVLRQPGSHQLSVIIGSQIRAARAFLRWSANRLATESKLGIATVRRAEAEDGILPISAISVDTLRRALEAAGVEFTNGGEPGVKLRSRP